MKELQVGDVILQYYHSTILYKLSVLRVTKTLAFTEHMKFRREYVEGSGLHEIPSRSFSSAYYTVATPELLAEAEKTLKMKELINKINEINWKELSIKTLEKVIVIIEEVTDEANR